MARKAKKRAASKPSPTQRVGEDGPPISTLALGEETVWTTLALGEESPTYFYGEQPTHLLGEQTHLLGEHPTTFVFPGEEHPQPTTLVAGEEGPGGGPTTLAIGEEGPHPTTLVGEDKPPTRRKGEQGPITTQMVGEDKPKPASRRKSKKKKAKAAT